jgi:hypothetical protein
MIRMFFPYSFYPFKAMKIPSGYFFSKIKSPRSFYTRDDIYDYTRSVQMEITICVYPFLASGRDRTPQSGP